ncbi:MAG TPA: DUF4279 domain-containing protein [Gallionella sp.]|nr:DUF4279 domain-containing protein [Gallionella sp.]
MSEPNRQYAYFSLHGAFDPGEITLTVGVQPSECWNKGDLHPTRRFERKASHWKLRSRLSEWEPIEAHIADVLAQLEENPAGFIKVSEMHGGCMQLVGFFHDGYPGLHFEPELVLGLAKYHLEIDFDFYNLWSDAREDT